MNHHSVGDNIQNGASSLGIAGIMVWIWQNVGPWALHTAGAILSAATVAICIFILNRWLHNSPWIDKHFPKKK